MRSVRLLAPLVFLLLVVPFARAASLPEALVEHLLASSVTVSTPEGTGSGCIIVRGDRAYILTAAHVVEGSRPGQAQALFRLRGGFGAFACEACQCPATAQAEWRPVTIYQRLTQDGEKVARKEFVCDVIRYDAPEGQDLAILRVRLDKAFDCKASTKFYLDRKVPRLGLDLAHCGSPLGDFGTGSILPCSLAAHGRKLAEGGPSFDQIAGCLHPGCSGGQVTLLDGRYIGMVQRGVVGGFVLIRPVREIRKWSKRVGVEFLLDPKLPVPSDEVLLGRAVEEGK